MAIKGERGYLYLYLSDFHKPFLFACVVCGCVFVHTCLTLPSMCRGHGCEGGRKTKICISDHINHLMCVRASVQLKRVHVRGSLRDTRKGRGRQKEKGSDL